MIKILLISHFGLASGLKNTLSYFIVDDQEKVQAIDAYLNGEDPKEALNLYFENIKETDKVIIFSDILGGSVNQYCLPYMKDKQVYLFAGFNLPMVLQSTFLSNLATDEEIKSLETVGREAVVFMNDYTFETFSEDDE